MTIFEGATRTHMVVNNFSGPYPDVIDGGLFTETTDFGILDGGTFLTFSHDLVDGGSF